MTACSPHLCAHLVHGEPVLDIAKPTSCAVCNADAAVVDFIVPETSDCHECKGTGVWWITSAGHRLRPYWTEKLNVLGYNNSYLGEFEFIPLMEEIPDPPDSAEDSWSAHAAPTPPTPATRNFLETLGLLKPKGPTRRI